MRGLRAVGVLVLALLAVGAGFVVAAALDIGDRSPSPSVPRPTRSPLAKAVGRRAPPSSRAGRAGHRSAHARRGSGRAPATTPAIVTGGTPRRRLIALTFDDGPGPYTARIIAELSRLHVPATFFVVGQQLVDFATEARAELAHGFVIGDHTENHAWLVRLNAAGQYAQIDTALLRLRHLRIPRPTLFRPPYGSMNRITFQVTARLHLTAVLWSVDPSDWARPGTTRIVARVLAHARPGAIVLLHDGGGDRSETVAALPIIVRDLRARGYTLVTVPRLIALDPPPAHPHLPSFVSDR